jgi:hypothetical protein
MAQFINQNSFLLFVIPVVLLILFFLLRPPGSVVKQVLALLLLATVVLGFLVTRPGGNPASGQRAESLLNDGDRPVFVEIYSPY